MGEVPPKRHTQFRRPDGELYTEELFGNEGFSGLASLLYHYHPPVRVTGIKPCPLEAPEEWREPVQRHYHLRTKAAEPAGDPITGPPRAHVQRRLSLGIARPTEPMDGYFYKNGEADELYFIHEGTGRFETMFGALPYHEGDYVLIPHGTIYRVVHGRDKPQRWLMVESRNHIEPPKRYRNEFGQLLEHSPYCERDIRVPEEPLTIRRRSGQGPFEVRIKANDMLSAYYYDHHPLRRGRLGRLSLSLDLQHRATSSRSPGASTSRRPTHQTFQAHNFVVCSFVPRKYDYHPLASPRPITTSNIDSEEVLYYVNGNFM